MVIYNELDNIKTYKHEKIASKYDLNQGGKIEEIGQQAIGNSKAITFYQFWLPYMFAYRR